jgi:ribonuclease Y
MITDKLVQDAVAYAESEINKFGFPTTLHFNLTMSKAKEIAQKLHADVNLAIVGAALMDLKLGEAFQQGRLAEHVAISADASRKFLANYNLNGEEIAKVLNCVEAHHGSIPHSCLESQIATNADCYKFLHPAGLLSYIGTLSKRENDFTKVIAGAEAKLEEKYALLSLDVCKKELNQFYVDFKKMFAEAKKVL